VRRACLASVTSKSARWRDPPAQAAWDRLFLSPFRILAGGSLPSTSLAAVRIEGCHRCLGSQADVAAANRPRAFEVGAPGRRQSGHRSAPRPAAAPLFYCDWMYCRAAQIHRLGPFRFQIPDAGRRPVRSNGGQRESSPNHLQQKRLGRAPPGCVAHISKARGGAGHHRQGWRWARRTLVIVGDRRRRSSLSMAGGRHGSNDMVWTIFQGHGGGHGPGHCSPAEFTAAGRGSAQALCPASREERIASRSDSGRSGRGRHQGRIDTQGEAPGGSEIKKPGSPPRAIGYQRVGPGILSGHPHGMALKQDPPNGIVNSRLRR